MSLLASWLASPPPDAAIEIAPEAVSVAVLSSRGAEASVQAYASAPLPSGAVAPSLLARNILDRAAVAGALRTACERAGVRPRRAALVIPDLAARVSLARFEQIPARHEDLDQLIRWQAKKSSPFPAEEVCLTYSPGARSGARRRIRRRPSPGARPFGSTKACATRPASTPAWSISRRSAS